MKKSLLTVTAIALTMSVGGIVYANSKEAGSWHAKREAIMNEKLSSLTPEHQTLVKAVFKDGREQFKASREEMKAQHDALREILTAPKFDRAAFLAKSKELRSKREEQMQQQAARIADVAEKLSPAERKVLAEVMPPHGMKHHKGGDHKRHDDATPPPSAPL